ncbi:30S ribosome-binding factor RbfA [Buchnera aphidicola]|uniref:30S ribosome-binding factor RbfA n=1 Tax=Buchnera aphidicola TaxID=9 RepID=UPI003464C6C5
MKNFKRSIRISQELKKEISVILQKYLQDPRINFTITVSMVKVSQDLSLAKIFISYLDSYKSHVNNFKNFNSIKDIILILQKASKYIRSILCKKINLRKMPELIFLHDNSLSEGIKISNLLKNVIR